MSKPFVLDRSECEVKDLSWGPVRILHRPTGRLVMVDKGEEEAGYRDLELYLERRRGDDSLRRPLPAAPVDPPHGYNKWLS